MSEGGGETDEQLFERARRELPHRTGAYRLLVQRHTASVFARAQRILRQRADAEDATQEVFLSVLRAIPHTVLERSFRSWLNGITVNAALMILRQQRAEGRRRDAIAQGSPVAPVSPVDDPVLRHVLEELLDELPADTRVALTLRFLEDRSYPEIASLLDKKESAVKMQVIRACEGLRARYRERLGRALEQGDG